MKNKNTLQAHKIHTKNKITSNKRDTKMDKISKNLAETTIKLLGDRWKVQIIDCLMDGTKRFGELKKELGDITQKVLTSNLRMLEENGILVRHVYAEIPPRVDYTLTAIGYNLKPVIDSMVAWAEEYRELLLSELKDIELSSKITPIKAIS